MPEYMLLAACMFILAVTGVLDVPCKAVGLSRLKVCYVLLCAMAMSPFALRPTVEISLNTGAVIMVFLPVLVMGAQDCRGGGIVAAVVLFSAVIALLRRSGMLYGAENGVLSGLMAGASAILLAERPGSAAFCACVIPIFTEVVGAFLTLANIGYASLEVGTETLAAQLMALSIAVCIVWAQAAAAEGLRTE